MTRNEQIIAWAAIGDSYSDIAQRLEITTGAVAGVLYRNRHSKKERNAYERERVRRHRSVPAAKERSLWTEARLTETWAARKERRASCQ